MKRQIYVVSLKQSQIESLIMFTICIDHQDTMWWMRRICIFKFWKVQKEIRKDKLCCFLQSKVKLNQLKNNVSLLCLYRFNKILTTFVLPSCYRDPREFSWSNNPSTDRYFNTRDIHLSLIICITSSTWSYTITATTWLYRSCRSHQQHGISHIVGVSRPAKTGAPAADRDFGWIAKSGSVCDIAAHYLAATEQRTTGS